MCDKSVKRVGIAKDMEKDVLRTHSEMFLQYLLTSHEISLCVSLWKVLGSKDHIGDQGARSSSFMAKALERQTYRTQAFQHQLLHEHIIRVNVYIYIYVHNVYIYIYIIYT